MLIYWLRLQGVTRSNAEDNVGWCIFSIGAAATGAGISMRQLRPANVLLIALISPCALFAGFVILVWGGILLYALFYEVALRL